MKPRGTDSPVRRDAQISRSPTVAPYLRDEMDLTTLPTPFTDTVRTLLPSTSSGPAGALTQCSIRRRLHLSAIRHFL